MGHRLSKSPTTRTDATSKQQPKAIKPTEPPPIKVIASTNSNQNLQIESATATVTVPESAGAGPSRIIIKIQLTKMESGDCVSAEQDIQNNNLEEEKSLESSSACGNNNSINITVQQMNENSISQQVVAAEECSNVPDSRNSRKEPSPCRTEGLTATMCAEDGSKHHCCRRKKSSAYPSKWRCCKCACRHAVKKIIDNTSSSSRSSKSSKKEPTAAQNNLAEWAPRESSSPASTSASSSSSASTSPVILVLQCPQASQFVTVSRLDDFDEQTRRLRALELETGVDPLIPELESALNQRPWQIPRQFLPNTFPAHAHASGAGPVVHSQIDYIHCLVPDLEKITSSSFYWGKMDRYEAERLLEGKPGGTFLLRDSAQDDYLFSVTFRKYGRSLHARIEQFNKRFSFDHHDPGVFTAPTVTGLLEHYKDPSCVLFFEPLLAIPLNRNFSFSLQQLCRAKIVSNTSYDGINKLELPNSLKSYLKEYHYKMPVREKPFDELGFYSTCS